MEYNGPVNPHQVDRAGSPHQIERAGSSTWSYGSPRQQYQSANVDGASFGNDENPVYCNI
jgi:hypothetical protein